MMRAFAVFTAIGWVASAESPQTAGEALLEQCDFKAAARAFERALTSEPESARLHFRLGTSYARLAEVSSVLSARRNARKAQAHLEAAVRLDPDNRDFLMELFEFYVESPEWFEGGLDRANTILDRLGPDDGGPATPSRTVADSRKEHSVPAWALRKGILRASAVLGYLGAGGGTAAFRLRRKRMSAPQR